MSTSNTSVSYILPSTQTPLFTAEWVTCAYPVSDLYASVPRYLYYALLVLVFLTQWHSWLANVFLGVVATYAGTAAIEAFILIANRPATQTPDTVSIPFIDPTNVSGNDTLSVIPNFLVNITTIIVQPAALEYDIDALLAITVTGYLMMLPMHCWSSAVRTSRARHLLIFLWNLLMFAGMLCSIFLWPDLFDTPLQYRFCYPTILDTPSTTSDGHYPSTFWQGTWNATIHTLFSNFTVFSSLTDNCLNPCFNTSQVLRRPNSLVSTTSTTPHARNPRLGIALQWAHIISANDDGINKDSNLANLMYVAIIVTTIIMIVFLIFALSPARHLTRIPVQRPKDLLWSARKEIFHMLWKEFKQGSTTFFSSVIHPQTTYKTLSTSPRHIILKHIHSTTRFTIDILALLTLFTAMILTPLTTIIFIIWIEYYIHSDLVSSENPQQVGQWGSIVSVALILVSAAVLRLRYVLATRGEVEGEIEGVERRLVELEGLLEEKRGREEGRGQGRLGIDAGSGGGVGAGAGGIV